MGTVTLTAITVLINFRTRPQSSLGSGHYVIIAITTRARVRVRAIVIAIVIARGGHIIEICGPRQSEKKKNNLESISIKF